MELSRMPGISKRAYCKRCESDVRASRLISGHCKHCNAFLIRQFVNQGR